MNICPITYSACDGRYSKAGLKLFSRNLSELNDLPFTAEEQIREAAARASKMSIQGVQPKLSAVLNTRKQVFELVDINGQFILKPQNPMYPELPENEDLTMRLAKLSGIEVPLHSLLYSKDGSLTYCIKRFDRLPGGKKAAVEDFSQLMGLTRETKYNTSMEKVAAVTDRFCTFPAVEKVKLFRLTLFNFLTGNEDMHVKNFSLLTKPGRSKPDKIELSPAYDLLNTSIAIGKPAEETALPIKAKKNKITREILADYFAGERLGLNDKVISSVIENIKSVLPAWNELINISFLSNKMKDKYKLLVNKRIDRIFGIGYHLAQLKVPEVRKSLQKYFI
ncbi:HipA kinase-like C-terminal domain-containing protein [Desulfonema limicola]|uniref:HipA kinase-like C-terminal domain-containing protein n=1 Tax=Desulfonema limicola TaxID=45656 RepID=A0A975BAA8_9BACT|nr:HipA domain-containing protein [Desulfonema limicola]QTA81637.1 HipA kinase-like C-terminal domain-containing protein [Desulfonema limicola]